MRSAKIAGWFRGRFGRIAREDVTDFAKVLALMVLGIDPTNGEPSPAWKLSSRLQKRLLEAEGWPYDFADSHANETEQLLLDLWLITYALRVKRCGALKPETRDAFVHQVEEFVFGASDLPLDKSSELFQLHTRRFAEYSAAYRKSSSERNFDFVEAVTRNVFGKETNSIKAAVLIKLTTDAGFISLLLFLTGMGLHQKIARGMRKPARRTA
jgi:hypothetical protein